MTETRDEAHDASRVVGEPGLPSPTSSPNVTEQEPAPPALRDNAGEGTCTYPGAEKRSDAAGAELPADGSSAGSDGPAPAAADGPTSAQAVTAHEWEASAVTAPAGGVLPFALVWILVVSVLTAIAIGGVAIAIVEIGSVGAEWLEEWRGGARGGAKPRPQKDCGEKQTKKKREKLRTSGRCVAPSNPDCSLALLAACTDKELVLRPGDSMHSLAATMLGASALEPGDNGRVTLAEREAALLYKAARWQLMLHYVTFNHRRSP